MDLNQAERKALRGATCLIGLGVIARTLLAPGVGDLGWEEGPGGSPDRSALAAEVRGALVEEQRAQTPLEPNERLDPNRASLTELRRLPGVGPALAAEMVRERDHRPFATASDLQRVAGIGEATARRLEPHLAFEATAISAASNPPRGSRSACGNAADRIDLNRATSAELERLPGIGPALAGRVIERRAAVGAFEIVEALLDVPGIGPGLLGKIEGRVCVGTS